MAVKARGTVVNVAIWEKEVPFQPNMLTFKEGNYTAVLGYQRRDFEAVIENLANGKGSVGDYLQRVLIHLMQVP